MTNFGDDRLPEPTTQVPHPTIVRYSLIIAQFDHITRSTICFIAAAHRVALELIMYSQRIKP